ncbi:MAG: hypothetical protein IPL40_08580 [Proteobacteria bacterium]|nr:hypothetical protein [Pseudomonadota bacterium]
MLKPGEKSVLVLQSSPKSRRLTARAIAATGASCAAPPTGEQSTQALLSTALDVLVVDWENAPLAQQAVKLNPRIEVVLLTDRPAFERYAEDIMDLPMSSMIVSSFVAVPDANDPVATRELVTTVAKLFTGDIFGLEKYMGWGAAIREQEIRASSEAEGIVQSACEDAARAGMPERELSSLGLLVDELCTNAVWDAPVDAGGQPRYADKSRAQPVTLAANEHVTVRYGSDGNLFGVSVADNFGRLDQDLAVRYIRKCFRRNDQQVSKNTGGAGLGLYMAFNSVSSFVINVDPGVRTEVIGLIRLGRPPKPAAGENPGTSRSLCYFRTKRPKKGE